MVQTRRQLALDQAEEGEDYHGVHCPPLLRRGQQRDTREYHLEERQAGLEQCRRGSGKELFLRPERHSGPKR